MTYTGTIQVLGIVTVSVEAGSMSEAKQLIERRPSDYKVGEVEAIVFEGWENLPEPEE